ncbi:MAG: hypothetical protein IT354_14690 [Gemmatimonadaceae bacterium]|nr:hypothetical protein [Gemmatimonadaceae bacterium]
MQTEGAGFWLRVRTQLPRRGVDDILRASMASARLPTRLPQVLTQALVHHGVVHLVRQRLALAAPLAARRAGLHLSAGDSRAPLHDERGWESTHGFPEDRGDLGPLSE